MFCKDEKEPDRLSVFFFDKYDNMINMIKTLFYKGHFKISISGRRIFSPDFILPNG